MTIRVYAAVVLVALGCSCTDKAAQQKEQENRWHGQMVTALRFRQVYDADELATRLRHETDSRLVMAEVLGSSSFLASKSHYMRLAPNRLEPSNRSNEIAIRTGALRLVGTRDERDVSYVFPESRTRSLGTSMTGEQWGGERATFDYTGGEWDSGYYPAYGYYVEPVVLVLAMNGIAEDQPLLEAARPDYVPATYLLPLEWREDVKATLADWPKFLTEDERGRYLENIAEDRVKSRPLARLMAWQVRVAGDAQESLGHLTDNDLNNDPVFTGALTYHILRHGSEGEQAAYVKCVGRMLAKFDGRISTEGLVLGAAEACTKFRLINHERLKEIRNELKILDAKATMAEADYDRRRQLLQELTDLCKRDPMPSSLNRLLAVLTRQVSPDDAGSRYILERIVSRRGPGAMYPDRSDRNP